MSKEIQNKLVLSIIIIVVIGMFFFFSNMNQIGITGSTTEIDKLSICLNKNSIMYGSDSCPYCIKQKELFGDSFKYIKYIDCLKNREACLNADIKAFPTWVINGKSYEGLKTLQELKELSGC